MVPVRLPLASLPLKPFTAVEPSNPPPDSRCQTGIRPVEACSPRRRLGTLPRSPITPVKPARRLNRIEWGYRLVTRFLACVVVAIGPSPLAAEDSHRVANLRTKPLNPPSTAAGPTLFHSLSPEQTGVQVVHEFPRSGSSELLQDQGAGAGLCLADFDGNGLPDIFVTQFDRGNRLYKNLGRWRFDDVSQAAGIEAAGRWCSGATAVDIDQDGDLDLAVTVFNAPNLLFVNQGDGRFTEHAETLGLAFSGASVMYAFADYDRDGRLDAYLVTHRLSVGPEHRLPRNGQESVARSIVQLGTDRRARLNPKYDELFGLVEKGPGRVELFIAGQRDLLLHNRGNLGFTNVASTSGIQGNDVGLAAAWWDYDSDGLPDLYVSNDYKGADRLYRNQGNGTFRDVAALALPHIPLSSMGTDVADINNDRHLDLLATEMAGYHRQRRMMILDDPRDRWFLQSATPRQVPRNALYLGTGSERVLEVAHLAGLAHTDWTWSPKFGDFDNDGWVDLFIANGMSRDFVNADLLRTLRDRGNRSWRDRPMLKEANLAFQNRGDLAFAEVGATWGLNSNTASFGAAVGDLDRDGDLDLVVMNLGEPLGLFRNDSVSGHRLLVRLHGRRSNAFGVGAVVQVQTAALSMTRQLGLASGFLSANEPILHFGLGPDPNIQSLTVTWPSGARSSFTNLIADQWIDIDEPDAPVRTPPQARTPITPRFRRLNAPDGLRHRESDFDDFEREPLLPWKLSQFGPGLAVGDVDGDGREDFYLSGAAGAAGQLAVRLTEPGFQLSIQDAWISDAASEDLGSLFFDSDADGDLDLYVVSGGVECGKGDVRLQDRLYLNDGRGHFSKAPVDTLPSLRDSGTVVAAADVDRDGDLDLFLGGGTVPGQYPLGSPSRILTHHEGTFRDATDTLAPGLAAVGRVTSALWTDVENDGWPDLIVLQHWGPIRLFRQVAGRFEERTESAGLTNLTGAWNGIVAGDVDEDGDLDYVVTNLGLNTRYRPGPEHPIQAFHGVFDDTGSPQWVEAMFEGSSLFPIRSLETLSAGIPSLLARFGTYQAYAEAPLTQVLSAAAIAGAQRYEMAHLESGVLVQQSPGRFRFEPLPRLAQAAPAFGAALLDVDADGHLDLVLAQNFFGPPVETGRWDGGMGLVLSGDGRGKFQPIAPAASGIMIDGDAKSLAVTDLNDDGHPDLVFGLNHAAPLLWMNQPAPGERRVRIALRGRPGNPHGVGARVTLRLARGGTRIAETHAGSGYLSQSTASLSFGLGATGRVEGVDVRWPSGRTTSVHPKSDLTRIELTE